MKGRISLQIGSKVDQKNDIQRKTGDFDLEDDIFIDR